mmetsp:Transcript_20579/g.58777  ORF Transcript_20579/g.58777 Transcript_20579/m.58777 type:complete len:192 (-) Transcript_20579:242-817(-)
MSQLRRHAGQDSSNPANACVFNIEQGTALGVCSARTWNEQMSQPAVAAGWSSQRWMDFSKKMASYVRSFKKDGYAVLGLLLIPVGIILIIIELAPPLGEVVVFLAFVVTYGLSTWMRGANQAIDAKIEALCRQFSDCSVQLQYVTRCTGACKRQNEQTYRGLNMTPGVVQGSEAVTALVVPVPCVVEATVV